MRCLRGFLDYYMVKFYFKTFNFIYEWVSSISRTEILPFEISQIIKVSNPWQRVWSFYDSQLFSPPILVPKVLLTPSMNQIRVSNLSFSNVYLQEPNVRGIFKKVQKNLLGQCLFTQYHRVSYVLYCVPFEKIILSNIYQSL